MYSYTASGVEVPALLVAVSLNWYLIFSCRPAIVTVVVAIVTLPEGAAEHLETLL